MIIEVVFKIYLGTLVSEFVEEGEEKRKRYGHAACTWEDMLIIIGGSKYYNKLTCRRDCMNDILIYNPVESQWTELQCSGLTFEHRRYHSACMVGRYLLVYGGINSYDNYLSNLLGILMGKVNNNWKQRIYKWFEVLPKGDKPKKLAFHTTQLVLQRERYRGLLPMDLFSLPEIRGISSRVYFYFEIDKIRRNVFVWWKR